MAMVALHCPDCMSLRVSVNGRNDCRCNECGSSFHADESYVEFGEVYSILRDVAAQAYEQEKFITRIEAHIERIYNSRRPLGALDRETLLDMLGVIDARNQKIQDRVEGND